MNGCQELMSSKKLSGVLGVILSIGNSLNSGTGQGNASGFRLETLTKLNDTKSTAKKASAATLMHYVALLISRSQPELLRFSEEIPSVLAASKISFSAIPGDIQQLKQSLADFIVELEMDRKSAKSGSTFSQNMQPFAEEASAKMESLEALFQAFTKAHLKAVSYFGEDPTVMSADDFFQTWATFVARIEAAHKENEAQTRRASKLSEGPRRSSGAPANTSPKSPPQNPPAQGRR
eukprot:TRINITY_DN353_c1_g4_i2.p1 TRINITY_DN353_c1_g4~~TRINITY_DN353_c1_g4_i2.p1  ORF type:complete len:235 (+),score=51.64 TRINITY_DN353_c1_g4_i2:74-778(+)